MKLLDTLKAIFAGNDGRRPDDASAWFYVRCRRCGEVIKVRVDMRNDPSEDEDGQYVVHKTLVGGARRCFARLEMTLILDAGRHVRGQEVTGGEFVSADDYRAFIAADAQDQAAADVSNDDQATTPSR